MILIATESGKLVSVNDDLSLPDVLYQFPKSIMGIVRDPNVGDYFINTNYGMYRFDLNRRAITHDDVFNRQVAYHHMIWHADHIWVSVTNRNEIWKFDRNLMHKSAIRIDPPKQDKPIRRKVNYNHINSVWRDGDFWYVNLNWLTCRQYGPSGVAVFDSAWNELRRFEYGWETHAFRIYESALYALCGSSAGIKRVNHPARGGMMVNGDMVWEHGPKIFCKDWLALDDGYVIGGGYTAARRQRQEAAAIVIRLDSNFKECNRVEYPGMGGIKGLLHV